jgi:hypothetical protein
VVWCAITSELVCLVPEEVHVDILVLDHMEEGIEEWVEEWVLTEPVLA